LAESPRAVEPPAEAEAEAAPSMADSLEAAQPAAEELPAPPGAGPEQARFILAAAPAARASQQATGVPASVTIAQAILESSWGESKLARDGNNYFGIKARRQPGTNGVVWFNTWEVENGANVIRNEPFRAYQTPTDSFVDHGHFFHQNPRYAAALAANADPRQFAREINAAGYATDPNYSNKLIALMDRFNLYRYDLR
jgi:flagellum-specific peptidoglycan hydrolase FlgJ